MAAADLAPPYCDGLRVAVKPFSLAEGRWGVSLGDHTPSQVRAAVGASPPEAQALPRSSTSI